MTTLGEARPAQAAQGAVCEEHVAASVERQVPGDEGVPYLYRQRTYTCIHPGSRFPVQLTVSERYPEAAGTARASFDAEADAFFDSLRFG